MVSCLPAINIAVLRIQEHLQLRKQCMKSASAKCTKEGAMNALSLSLDVHEQEQ